MVMRLAYILILAMPFLLGCKVRKTDVLNFDEIKLRPGYQINYNLAYGDERYQFILDMMEVDSLIQFRYTMTNTRNNTAIITITPASLDTATIQKNTFTSYDDTLSNSEITVWFSQKMFSEIMTKDTSVFNGNYSGWGNKLTSFYNAGKTEYRYELNGVPQTIEVIHVVEMADNPKEFWVLNDAENPMIIKMNVGWEIWLKEINHNYE